MPLLYPLADATVGAALRLAWRPVVEGVEAVPREGGVVLAANHCSIADQLFLGSVLPRPIAFWAKAEYFARDPLTRAVLAGLGAIPVDRSGGGAADSAFEAAVPVLRDGGVVAVFPEGTRSPDGRLYRGRTGTVRLARSAGVPVVPVGITGTGQVRPTRPRPGGVRLRFGEPLDVGGGDVRTATDALMAAIRQLSGQEYVAHYAPRRAA